jgi:hypothetical protein
MNAADCGDAIMPPGGQRGGPAAQSGEITLLPDGQIRREVVTPKQKVAHGYR